MTTDAKAIETEGRLSTLETKVESLDDDVSEIKGELSKRLDRQFRLLIGIALMVVGGIVAFMIKGG